MFDSLFTPFCIGGLELKNRMIVPPMLSNYCTDDGFVTDKLIAYHGAKAQGGFAMITVGQAVISPFCKTQPNQMGIWDDRHVPGLRALTDAIHAGGAKASIEINHAGRATISYPAGSSPAAPSCIPDPLAEIMPHAMDANEIADTVEQFYQAARRAKEAGFDAVTIHGHARYLIASFLSPITNKRTDEYGGTLWNRTRFAREVADAFRSAVGPDIPLIFRMSATEFVSGGMTVEDTLAIASIMSDSGIDALDLSAGNSYSGQYIIPPAAVPHGYLAQTARLFRDSLHIPVAVAGRINEPFTARSIVDSGMADLISMGRASIADPQFVNKLRQGSLDDINYCVGCVQGCSGSVRCSRPITCLVNPGVGHESELALLPKAKRKKVLIAGGGVAGMEAAVTAAERGHDARLYEKSEKLGGQWLLAAVAPGKTEYTQLPVYLKNRLKKLGVPVLLNTALSEAIVREETPDCVIVATGARPVLPPIDGLSDAGAVFAHDVLSGAAEVGSKVVVIGGGLVGAETAEFLAAHKKQVSVIELMPDIARDGQPASNYFLMKNLRENRVEILTSAAVKYCERGLVSYEQNGELREIHPDSIVVAVGSKSQNALAQELKGLPCEVKVVGDASLVAKAIDAMAAAWQAAVEL